MFDFLAKRRRAALRAEPMPDAWRAIIDANVPYAKLLARVAPEDREELEALVRVFVGEKRFEGCGGLAMTDAIKVTIAAQACLLLIRRADRDAPVYPGLDSVLVYPHAYRAKSTRRDGAVVIESDDVRLGESWTRGAIVLAWDHVRAATHHVAPGHNVVLHELAHQLDAADGAMDGAPDLGSRERYAAWARVLGAELADLSARLDAALETDIDAYGATSPPEFFAVVTEAFFERPRQLRARHPELYAELARFYAQDPAELVERADAGSA